jgi:YgiT-type zinc finger domain-containing protein
VGRVLEDDHQRPLEKVGGRFVFTYDKKELTYGMILKSGLTLGQEGDRVMAKTKAMKCPICGGKLKKETITHNERWEGQLYTFSNVPALVCENCGDVSFEGKVIEKMEEIIKSNKVPERIEQARVYSLEKIPA